MTLLPEVERELVRTARRLTAADRAHQPASPTRGRDHSRVRELALIASLVVVACVITGALLGLRHGATPRHAGAATPSAPDQLIRWPPGRNVCPRISVLLHAPPRDGCVTVVSAPIAGPRLDRLLLTTQPGQEPYRLTVLSPAGTPLGQLAFSRPQPTIVSIANVNDRPGDEIFIRSGLGRVPDTSIFRPTIGIYTFTGRQLALASPIGFSLIRTPTVLDDYSCDNTGAVATFDVHRFVRTGPGRWTRTDITYQWVFSHLVVAATTTRRVSAAPSRLTTPGC